MTDGSGALGMLGENPIPQGTLDELRKEGADPARIACCAPRAPGVRGCAVENECPFHLQKYGGFKYKGPKNVGYYLRTHEGQQKQDFTSCHAFVRTLLSRMRSGIAAAQEGKPHEIIRIIGQEGDTIRQRYAEPVNPNDHTINARWRMVTKTVTIPAHPRPGDNPQTSYDQELWAEEKARRKHDPDFIIGPIEMADEPDEMLPAMTAEAIGDDEVLDMDLAKPVKKGK